MPKRARSDTVQINVRMKEPLRATLESIAEANGVSMNAEIVKRLDLSFDRDRNAIDPFGVMRIATAAFYEAGPHAKYAATGDAQRHFDFLDDPYAYSQAVKAAVKVLEAFRPDGEIVPPKSEVAHPRWKRAIEAGYLQLGDWKADHLLDEISVVTGAAPEEYLGWRQVGDREPEPQPPTKRAERMANSLKPSLVKHLRRRALGEEKK
jgi:Arc-like DNA binding domain